MKPRFLKTVVVLLVAAFLTAAVAPAANAENLLYENEPTAGSMVADFIFVRPFAILGLGLSTVAFGLSYPFAYWGNNTEEAKEKMVRDPFDYAFRRPLGDF